MAEIRVDPLSGAKAIVADGGARLDPDAPDPAREAQIDLFSARAARGTQETIAHAPPGVASLAALDRDALIAAVERWRERMRAHAGAAALHLVVDEPPAAAGAARPDSAAQLYALDFVPADIARERERFGAHAVRTMGGNLLGDLVQEEVKLRDRLVAIDDEAVLLAAYAARAPYQLLIAPRRPRPRFEDDGPSGAAMLHDALGRLGRRLGGAPPLALWVRTAPRGADHWCWRIDIVPRSAPLPGLELGAGLARSDVTPETAAAALREA